MSEESKALILLQNLGYSMKKSPQDGFIYILRGVNPNTSHNCYQYKVVKSMNSVESFWMKKKQYVAFKIGKLKWKKA